MKQFIIANDKDFAEAEAFCIAREDQEGGAGPEILGAVRPIVNAVREKGDAAVAEYTERLDGVKLSPAEFEITSEDIDQAIKDVDPALLAALQRAHDNILRFHEKNLRQSFEEELPDGSILGQRIDPIESVGVYVPGGRAFYPSSALMNLVPAKVAGVPEIVMVSVPSYKGSIHPLALAAGRMGGATRIFRAQGVAAIAALAYGTETFPQVCKITGPANAYVTTAKRLVSTFCAIDKEAGPSDVVVIADGTQDPALAAIELICQGEHGPESPTTLITTSAEFADKVEAAVAVELGNLSRANIARQALETVGAVFVVRTLDEACALSNIIAPEHLAIQTADPKAVFAQIKHAGAVMLGAETPVSVSDYYAGPNHILPTNRQARFASPLTVEDFRKVTNYLRYSPERLRQDAEDIMLLAEAEELTAHARAIEMRR